MSNHCSQCGAPGSADRFCPRCGHPYPDAPAQPVYVPSSDADAAPPTGPPVAHPPAGPQEWSAPDRVRTPAGPGAATEAPRPPVGDLVRDASAFGLLLVSLFLPWDLADTTAGHWWALMPVLFAIVGISVSPIARVLPVGPVGVQLAKTAAIAPLLFAVLVTVAREAWQLADSGWSLFGLQPAGGIGSGLALALAGALLVAQPRAVDDLSGEPWDRLWWGLAVLAGAGAALLTALTWLWFVLQEMGWSFLAGNPSWLPSMLGGLALQLLVVGVPTVLLALRRGSGRRLTATVGFGWLALSVLAKLARPDEVTPGLVDVPLVETWRFPTAAGFLLGAAAALAVARGTVRWTDRSGDDLGGRWGTAYAAGLLAGVLLLLDALLGAWAMVREEMFPAPLVVVAVLGLAGAGLLLAAGASAATDRGRPLSLALAATAGTLGVVGVVVRRTTDVFGEGGLDAVSVLAWFVLPGLLAVSLLRQRSGAGTPPTGQ